MFTVIEAQKSARFTQDELSAIATELFHEDARLQQFTDFKAFFDYVAPIVSVLILERAGVSRMCHVNKRDAAQAYSFILARLTALLRQAGFTHWSNEEALAVLTQCA
ncbi:hypothetical protein [Piscirickettsia litoralis]|uniref:Uncharacterized protein n=1 Tax=Piscirickettsia litoralis TaxID=1891921 RepID=A0ABX3A179_9GAMM|nr:hypothetical protein [Piscirickettsia litoralis]ODN41977.1 hypothetical protein BGC07_02135 [Piscirickettsia litoralis]